MLLKIGAAKRADSVVGRMMDCHDRIRFFCDLANKLAAANDAPAEELVSTAQQVRRYFDEALPRHVRDEEESIEPRLRGQDAQVDEALDRMQTEHVQDEALIAELVALCRSIEEDAAGHVELGGRLGTVAKDLQQALLSHLESEERVVLPAIEKLLDAEAQAQIVEEMKSRRDPR